MGERTSVYWVIEKEKLEKIVKNSDTMISILKKLGYDCNPGGRYRDLKKRLDEDNIDYSHIPLGIGSNRGRKFPSNAISLEKVMIENSSYNRGSLKKRLLKDDILKNECSICGLTPEWNGKDLVMVLDHINGIRDDNRLENLRLLCPNCNSQTETFCSRGLKKESRKCKDCGIPIYKQSRSGVCNECYKNKYKKYDDIAQRKVKNRPSKEQLIKEIEETSYCAVGRKYGVSDKAVRKWVK